MRTKNLLAALFSFVFLSVSSAVSANNVTARTSGGWNTASTWSRSLTGTISIANNSTTVTISGGSFTGQVAVNDIIMLSTGTVLGQVQSITNATTLVVGTMNTGGAKSGSWASQAIPQSTDDVTIGEDYQVTLTSGTVTINKLTMATLSTASGQSLLSIGAATLNITTSLSMNGGGGSRTCKIAFTGAGTLNVGTDVTIGNGSNTATIDMTGFAATLKVGGVLSRTTVGGVFTAGAGTVEFTGAAAQAIPTTFTYNNVTLSGAGTKTVASGTLAVGGTLNASAPLNLSTNNPTVNITGSLAGTGNITKGNGTVTIGGSWTNSGTFPTGINATFNSASSVSIPSGTYGTLGISGPKTFAGNTVATTVALSGNAQASLDGNTLTTSAFTGGDKNNFIITNSTGTVNATGTSMTFPVGVGAGLYTPITITGNVSRPWAIRAQSGFSGYASTGTAGALPVVWQMTPTGSVTADVTFQYDESQFSGFVLPDYFNIYHWDTPPAPNVNNAPSKWVLAADSVVAGGVSGGVRTIALSGQSSFSPFAISSAASPLPVQLLAFSGRKSANGTVISWTTASESMNSGFEVQRAADNIHFTTIGFVRSQAVDGNSSRVLSYSFTDAAAATGRMYYRLKQVDLDGRGRMSQTIALSGIAAGELSVGGLYPNPVRKTAQMSVETVAAGNLTVRIIAPSGAVVRSSAVAAGTGINTLSVDTDGLAAGAYLLQVTDADGNKGTVRFIKQ